VSLDEETAVRPDTRAVAAYEQVYRRYRGLVNSLYGQR